MALLTVASAKGSPGATTTALLLGGMWPRPVIVAECDVSGADIPLRMSSATGGVLDHDRGLLSLAAAGRKGLSGELIRAHTQQITGGLDVLVGLRLPEQAAGLSQIWPLLGASFDGLTGCDVIVDLGRIGASGPQDALLRASRLVVLVCTTDPASVLHLRERLVGLSPVLDPGSAVGTPLAVAVVAGPKDRKAVEQIRSTLARTDVPLRGVWHLAHDPKGAAFFMGNGTGRADKTTLVKTARPFTSDCAATIAPFFEPAGPSMRGADIPRARTGRADTTSTDAR